MDTTKFGALLRELRKEKELTQEQLAEKMKVSNRTVSRWETGANVPDLDILIELSEFYQIDLKDLLKGERNVDPPSESNAELARDVAQYQAMEETKRMRILFYCIVGEILVMLGLLIVTMELFANVIGGFLFPFSLVAALLIYSIIMPWLQKQKSAISYRLTLNGGFLATIINNIAMIAMFFPDGKYHNYGLAGFIYAFLSQLFIYLMCGITVLVVNKRLAK